MAIALNLKILALLLSGIGLFLSAWMIIPAPNMALLTLGVGVPEVSPWLLVLNATAGGVSMVGVRHSWLQRLTLGASLVGLLLSAMPLIQMPATQQRIEVAMREALGTNYLEQIPNQLQIQMRSEPFSLTDSFTGINLREVRYTPDIQFASPDGVSLKMDIYRPLQVGKYPAIVVIYGGSWQRGDPKQNADFSRYMAAQGYTVFAIDYRHAPLYRFPAQLDDVLTALAFIRQHGSEYEADPERIALLGRSAGAHLAMLAAYQQSETLPVRAVVSYYGPIDLAEGYANPPRPDPINSRSVLRAFLGGSPAELPDLYQKASPINYAIRPQPPTLLVYGRNEHVVQVRFAQGMYHRLLASGTTAILLDIPWAEHAFDAIFSGPSNQLALYYTERFLAWALRS
ncbi:alpha/beta hydrolase [Synechocystis salina]|uniref:Alpha/beta hydrolase n=1 Tax=Synechocystis salina LEGE 00031 TaxID=1828736 RepID=A0ABR9VQ58_9SYNC|nr:alpha/beta hydrolase [Synechocystis salina]MBE9241788.1 alpha/beta hydrolase [Synechocystis salina LEGE 00041]MBE9253484.1 alpha/beta hydrolase [Synechocystis salina LEGE 00031]